MTTILSLLIYFLAIISFGCSSGVRNLIQFEFITDKYSTQSYSVENFQQILENPKFDRQKPTAIYSYGFTQTINQPAVREMVDAYLENGRFNFVLVNYNSILTYNILNVNGFGNNIAMSLIKIFDAGYSNFHLVGFSLGAQISGVVGRCVISLSNNKYIVPRITGLDPGQIPPFFGSLKDLNAGDAIFVDTIHGETRLFGSAKSLGNASFWVNGGISQPNCRASFFLLTSVCSHLMTPQYWAASVRSNNPQMFPAIDCPTYEDFLNGKCSAGSTSSMGLYADRSLSGRFYLNAQLPPKPTQ